MPQQTSQNLVFEWQGHSLAGSLHLPRSEDRHPLVLMLQGSGPADRDSGGFFDEIRKAFNAHQIATFAFDKPGCGESDGDWRQHGLEDRASQASSALDMLRQHQNIEAAHIGVWGHSQGGWIVQILASRTPDLAFAVTNSGPSINLPDQNLFGCEHTMRDDGHSEASISEALSYVDRIHDAARRHVDYETVEGEILRTARDQPWYEYMSIADSEEWDFAKLLVSEGYEPLRALQSIRCPFLAIYGGLDLLVPAWQGAQESGEALTAAENHDATVVVFPGANHRIQNPGTSDFVTGYLDLLGDWTRQRVTQA